MASKSLSAKLLEMFKNLKSDAVPRSPRPAEDISNDTSEQPTVHIEVEDDEAEEIIIEPEEDIKKNSKKKTSKPKKKNVVYEEEEEVNIKSNKHKRDSSSSVNVQATGNVYNIVNSKEIRLGNDYYFGPVSPSPSQTKPKGKYHEEEEDIKKDNLIKLVMEAEVKPDNDYLHYISNHLGKNWQTFFRSLDFSQGQIDTAEINAAGYGVAEARYKLLLDWVRNDDDGSLGRLATLLWDEGERSIVKELSVMYMKSKK